MLFFFKILLFGALAFLSLIALNPFIPPMHLPGSKPKVAFYVPSLFLSYTTVLPSFLDRPDVAALYFFSVDLFRCFFPQFRIVNLYNLWS